MVNEMVYTQKEMTVKTHTVNSAVEAAKMILKDRNHTGAVCIDHLKKNNLQLTDSITIYELNHICDFIIRDTQHHSYRPSIKT